ncbi:MAG: mitochondrial fission ELM1 family protein [Kiloniellales bacterium]
MTAARHSGDLTCWVVSDGRAGIEIQCRGLAERIGCEPLIKRIKARWPWRSLPPAFWIDPLRHLSPSGDLLQPPWPDLLIGTGRLAVAPNLAVRRASKGRTFTIQIQDPKVAPANFDLVIVPEHDRLRGPNVITTRGSLHGITEERLAAAAAKWAPRVAALARPRVTVLIGGDSRTHRLTRENAERLGQGLATIAREQGAGLLVTPSRRTGPESLAIIRAALVRLPAAIWDGNGENPYLGYLALADAFVVTGDSVNMICEAAFTGKPIHIADISGGTAKFKRFHESMRQAGITRPFAGHIEQWSYPPQRETEAVAAEVRRRLGLAAHAPDGPEVSRSATGSD